MSKEFYRPEPIDADGAYRVAGIHIAGFLGTVAGTLTVTGDDNTVFLDAMPVATGFNRIAIALPTTGGAIVQLAGGAAGSLLV
jgi:ABC-type uncharacterized transport system permease subunit